MDAFLYLAFHCNPSSMVDQVNAPAPTTLKAVSLGYTAAAAADPVQETQAGNYCRSRAQANRIRKK